MELFMMVIGIVIKDMEREQLFIKIEIYILVIGQIIKEMVLEQLSIKIGIYIKVLGQIIKRQLNINAKYNLKLLY